MSIPEKAMIRYVRLMARYLERYEGGVCLSEEAPQNEMDHLWELMTASERDQVEHLTGMLDRGERPLEDFKERWCGKES